MKDLKIVICCTSLQIPMEFSSNSPHKVVFLCSDLHHEANPLSSLWDGRGADVERSASDQSIARSVPTLLMCGSVLGQLKPALPLVAIS